jgi:WD40 repeat protein/DNA-binding SARP family transcriptional activator
MHAFSLSLFGRFQALLNDEPLAGFRTAKVQALLMYLAADPTTPQRRETLMTLLWPGMPERSARQNLRQIIYNLRRAVPDLPQKSEGGENIAETAVPLLLANRQTIQLNPLADISSDVARFESLIESTQSHDHLDILLCQECRRNLETAVDLYKGDFLADFYLDDSNEFEEWAEIQRQQYRRQVLDALETLTTIATRGASYVEARAYAEQQLEIDNLRESAYRQLMKILALNGQRTEALAVYESFSRLMAKELGMAPAKRTTERYEQIRAGDLNFTPPAAQGVRGLELKEKIGEGTYGAVHRAVQPAVSREVAVKVIRRKYADDPEFIRRFEAEAQVIARLEHPYIVPLYDYWREPDGAFLVMRLLRGGNLLASLQGGPWDLEPTIKMVDQISSALAVAHRQGVIHRDIKPANILLDEAGNAYLSDFGIAKQMAGDLHLTAAGAIMGTPDYISPEQLRDEVVGPPSDIYSLGAVLYETLTGERPFPDVSMAMIIQKQLQEPIPPLSASRPDLPREIDAVIQRATAKQPADRYDNALAMAEAFRQATRGVSAEQPVVIDAGIPGAVPPEVDIVNPYKGLRAFQETDAADFFGREKLVEQLVERFCDSRFVAVVGPSGSGKSSVVKAGLIPALRQGAIEGSENWFVAEMVPGEYPLEELEMALLPVAVDPPPSLVEPMQKDKRGMLRTIRRILPDEEGAQLLLVIDQFEELFTLVENEERRTFFLDSLLAAITAPHSPLRVAITLRADFYDRPLQLQPLGQWIKENTEIVLPMAADELTWAIQEPARRAGVGLEAGLTPAIVADVVNEPGALPLLQYAMTELFDERRNGAMTRAAYEEIGGVMGALGGRAEEIYKSLDPSGKEAARQMFLRLVTLGEGVEDTRRRVLREELEGISVQYSVNSEQSTANDQLSMDNDEQSAASSQPTTTANPTSDIPHPTSSDSAFDTSDISTVIDLFGRYRLLTFDRDPLTRGATVEVAHEALLREWPRLREWLDESRADVRLQRLLAGETAEWQKAGKDDAYLLRGARLDQYGGWPEEANVSLTEEEQAFLAASFAARDQRRAEEEARIQRELETAQQLAETEKQRAEEQAEAAAELRRRAIILAGALGIAALLAVAAFFFANQSNINAAESEANAVVAQENADLAATREGEALQEAAARATAEAVAVAERNTAEEQTKLSTSRELALAALNNLDEDPERSILLALEALGVSHTNEAEEALHRAVQASQVRLLLQPKEENSTLEVLFSPDGSQLLTGDTAGEAILWDAETGEKLVTFDGHKEDWVQASDISYVMSPDYNPDGTRVATGGEDGTLRIWDPETGQELMAIEAHEDRVDGVAFSPDGAKILTASHDNTAKIWDAETGENLLTVEEIHPPEWEIWQTGAWGADFSPDGSRFATAGMDGRAKVWDAETGEELLVLTGHDDPVWDVAFSPDGTLIATSSVSSEAKIWDAETGEEIHNLDGHSGELRELDFSHDGTLLGTASADGQAKIWDVASGRELATLAGHKDRVMGIDFSPDGSQIATSSRDHTARIWEVGGGRESLAWGGEEEGVTALSYSPDGQRLATINWDGLTRIHNALTGERLLVLEGHDDWAGAIDYSPDGKLIASASDDGTAIVRDAQTGEQIFRLDGHDGEWVNDLAFSADSTLLATVGRDNYAVIWDLVSGTERQRFDHGDWVWGVSLSPDGRLLAAGGMDTGIVGEPGDGGIIVWDLESGERVHELLGHIQQVKKTIFSPDGAQLFTTSWDGTARLWDMTTGETLFVLDGHTGPVWNASLSPDGSIAATGAADGRVILWDLTKGTALMTLAQSGGNVGGIDFSPDGTRLLVSIERVYEYLLSLDDLTELARSRLTRDLTDEECRQYLHLDACP